MLIGHTSKPHLHPLVGVFILLLFILDFLHISYFLWRQRFIYIILTKCSSLM